MNVSHEIKDGNTAIIDVELNKEEIENSYQKELKEVARQTSLPGFRPGKAPKSFVEQKYGASIRYESLNKMVSDSLNQYLETQNFDFYGYPLPVANEEKEEDIKNADRPLHFKFELGLKPELELNLSSELSFTKYKVEPGEKELQDEINLMRRRYGSMTEGEIAEDNDLLTGDFEELNEKLEPLEEGVKATDKSLLLGVIKDAEQKAKFIGKKSGDVVQFDIFKVFDNSETEISSIFGISKELVNDLSKDFSFTIKTIRRALPAEMNEEFFAKISSPEKPIANEEDLKNAISADMTAYYDARANEMVNDDIINGLVKTHNITLPDDFLLRWIKSQYKETPEHELEHNYLHEKEFLKWSAIRDKIMRDNNIKIQASEIEDTYLNALRDYMGRYGYDFYHEAIRQEFEKKYFTREAQQENMVNMIGTAKALDFIKTKVSVIEKDIPAEEFNKLRMERSQKQKEHNH